MFFRFFLLFQVKCFVCLVLFGLVLASYLKKCLSSFFSSVLFINSFIACLLPGRQVGLKRQLESN